MSFKENLKSELDYKGIMVKELASLSGISRRTLDNYLRENESQPTVENAVKIARALGVTVEYLVTGETATQNKNKQSAIASASERIVKKYANEIQFLENLTPSKRKVFDSFLKDLDEWEK